MDYFKKGLLFYYSKKKLKERLAKVIFKKLLIGIQFLHDNGICHLDLKPENIILDKTFWPIILDFGFARKYKDEKENKILLKGNMGTDYYKCPEIWEKVEFYGDKADIFSLGVLLLNMVTGYYGFATAEETDDYYSLIKNNINEDYTEYWEKIKQENLSKEFKDLYVKMIAYNPENRPSIEKIFKSNWLKEINNLSQDEENEINKELDEIFKDLLKVEIEIQKAYNIIEKYGLKTKCGENDENAIFKDKRLKPK